MDRTFTLINGVVITMPEGINRQPRDTEEAIIERHVMFFLGERVENEFVCVDPQATTRLERKTVWDAEPCAEGSWVHLWNDIGGEG